MRDGRPQTPVVPLPVTYAHAPPPSSDHTSHLHHMESKTTAIETMSVRELKKLIVNAGLSHADCFEKPELRIRARDAINKAQAEAVNSAPAAASRLQAATHSALGLSRACRYGDAVAVLESALKAVVEDAGHASSDDVPRATKLCALNLLNKCYSALDVPTAGIGSAEATFVETGGSGLTAGILKGRRSGFKRAYALSQEMESEGDSLERAAAAMNMGGLRMRRGEFARAEPFLREALDMRRRIVTATGDRGPDKIFPLAASTAVLGDVLSAQSIREKVVEAVSLYEESIALKRECFGERHPEVATCLVNLAGIHSRQLGDYPKATKLLQLALKYEVEAVANPPAAGTMNPNGLPDVDATRAGNCAGMLVEVLMMSGHVAESIDVLRAHGHEMDQEIVQQLAPLMDVKCPSALRRMGEQLGQANEGKSTHDVASEMASSMGYERPAVSTCAACGTEEGAVALKQCARCGEAVYCNRVCQRQHWKVSYACDDCAVNPRPPSIFKLLFHSLALPCPPPITSHSHRRTRRTARRRWPANRRAAFNYT